MMIPCIKLYHKDLFNFFSFSLKSFKAAGGLRLDLHINCAGCLGCWVCECFPGMPCGGGIWVR